MKKYVPVLLIALFQLSSAFVQIGTPEAAAMVPFCAT